jgi:hypothetical protein
MKEPIGDTAVILQISVNKVLKMLVLSTYTIKPKQPHYISLEVDEFWTYAGRKKTKIWLIYAYHRASGEIVTYVWGKWDLKTACKLRKRLKRLGITYDTLASDDGDSLLTAFAEDID